MAVVLIIILGFFGVCILLGLIQAVYYKTVETIESRKIDKKIYEEQVVVNKIKGNANNVQSNERIYFSNGFYDISTDKFDYLLSEDGNKILGPYTKIINPFGGDNSLASVLIGDDVFYIVKQIVCCN